MKPDDYSYETDGFDGFMSRSIDSLSQVNLDSQGPVSTQLAYDRSQITGSLGDKFTIGRIVLDGIEGSITVISQDGKSANFYLGPKK